MSHNNYWFAILFVLLIIVIFGLAVYWSCVGYSYNNTCCPPVPPTVTASTPALGINIPVAGDTITLTGTNLNRITSLTVVFDDDPSNPGVGSVIHETFEVHNFYVNSDGTQLLFLSPFTVSNAAPTIASMILHLYYSHANAPIVFTMP